MIDSGKEAALLAAAAKRKARPKKVRESQVEAALCERVKDLGGTAYKFTSPARRSVPDRLVLLPGGRAAFVELKAPGVTPSDSQLREHAHLRRLGQRVFVIDTVAEAKAFDIP